MSSTLAHLISNLIDVAGRMRKIENAQRIVPMSLHNPLDPLRSILDGTHFLGALDTPPAQFGDFPDPQRSQHWPYGQSR